MDEIQIRTESEEKIRQLIKENEVLQEQIKKVREEENKKIQQLHRKKQEEADKEKEVIDKIISQLENLDHADSIQRLIIEHLQQYGLSKLNYENFIPSDKYSSLHDKDHVQRSEDLLGSDYEGNMTGRIQKIRQLFEQAKAKYFERIVQKLIDKKIVLKLGDRYHLTFPKEALVFRKIILEIEYPSDSIRKIEVENAFNGNFYGKIDHLPFVFISSSHKLVWCDRGNAHYYSGNSDDSDLD